MGDGIMNRNDPKESVVMWTKFNKEDGEKEQESGGTNPFNE